MDMFQSRDDYCRPNLVAYNIIIFGYVKYGNLAKAEEMFTHMKNNKEISGPDTVTYNTMMDCYVKFSTIDKAEALLEEMQAANSDIARPDTVTYNTLLDGYIKARKAKKAEGIFNGLKKGDFGCYPNPVTFSTMIKGFIRFNKGEEAEQLFEMMDYHKNRAFHPNHVTLCTMLDYYLKKLDIESGEKIFARLRKIATKSHYRPSSALFNLVIETYVNVGNMNKAITIFFDKLFKPTAQAFGAILGGYLSLSNPDKAEEFFRSVFDDNRLRSFANNPLFLVSLIKFLCSEELSQRAYNLQSDLSSMQHEVPAEVYDILIDAFVAEDDMKTCEELYGTLRGIEKYSLSEKEEFTPGVAVLKSMLLGYSRVSDSSQRNAGVLLLAHDIESHRSSEVKSDEELLRLLEDARSTNGEIAEVIAKPVTVQRPRSDSKSFTPEENKKKEVMSYSSKVTGGGSNANASSVSDPPPFMTIRKLNSDSNRLFQDFLVFNSPDEMESDNNYQKKKNYAYVAVHNNNS